jgi:hypothetical protein
VENSGSVDIECLASGYSPVVGDCSCPQLADLGGTVLTGSSTDFAELIAAETEKWAKVIRAANIKPE